MEKTKEEFIKEGTMRSFPQVYEKIYGWLTFAKLLDIKTFVKESPGVEKFVITSENGYLEINIDITKGIKIEMMSFKFTQNEKLFFGIDSPYLNHYFNVIEEFVKSL